jgi:hypothetical protein
MIERYTVKFGRRAEGATFLESASRALCNVSRIATSLMYYVSHFNQIGSSDRRGITESATSRRLEHLIAIWREMKTTWRQVRNGFTGGAGSFEDWSREIAAMV